LVFRSVRSLAAFYREPWARAAIALAATILLAFSCGAGAQGRDLGKIRSWAYQLQNVDPLQIRDSPYDLVVVDYGFSKDSAATYPREIVDLMRIKPNGERRFVFAYLSIGEAEQYRYYWDDSWRYQPPDWLQVENPQWPGNFLVQYWDPAWQALIYGKPSAYLDRILDAGFDGVYLDGVDKFEQWKDKHPSAAEDMVTLIDNLSSYARAKRNGFLVIPQNGDNLLYDHRLLRAIDGMSREDLLTGETAQDERNTPNSIAESVARLRVMLVTGKPVLVVEYPSSIDHGSELLEEIHNYGFVGYMASRKLNFLTPPQFGTMEKIEPVENPTGSAAAPFLNRDTEHH
jgi:cysteinyl-tRNA synthetase, unknown class